ncbi:MAG: tetratricopeptide repeat protein [Terrimicrobiaceae bacterium]
MTKIYLTIFLVAFTAPVLLGSALEEGQAALEEGLPSVALAKLSVIDPEVLDPIDQEQHRILMARALLATGDAEGAVKTLESLKSTGSVASQFWMAEGLARLGRHQEALELYKGATSEFGQDAIIGQARMLAALGQQAGATALLENSARTTQGRLDLAALYLDAGQPQKAASELALLETVTSPDMALRDYLLAWTHINTGQPDKAMEVLNRDSKPDAAMAVKLAVLKARTLRDSGEDDQAEAHLEKFIADHGRHKNLPEVFRELDLIYIRQTSPSSSELRRWAEDPSHSSRQNLATYYLARNELRLGRLDRAGRAFQTFLEQSPDHPLAENARREWSAAALGANKPEEALKILADKPGPGMDFQRGLAHAAAGHYEKAASSFHQSAEGSGWEAAKFNAALASILAGEEPGDDDAPRPITLQLAAAMAAASRRDPQTATLLERVASQNLSPWSDSARLALAEWKYLQLDREGARAELRQISAADDETAARASALSVFLLDDGSPDSEPSLLAAATQFLSTYPTAPLRADVLLKLGEVHFRRGDYLSAQSHLEQAAEARPGSPLAEKSQFLAGQAASRLLSELGTEQALEHYNDVASAGGPLAYRARLAQALLLNALNRPREAIPVLDSILSSEADETLRYAALIEKGDTYFLLGGKDPASYTEAIAAWRLAAEPNVPPRWKNQALVKIGAASEKLGELPAALASYHGVLSAQNDAEPEFFWFYKAGFDAARILEDQNKAAEAIEIYERLAASEGPRAEEARQRINSLRLENFLWED